MKLDVPNSEQPTHDSPPTESPASQQRFVDFQLLLAQFSTLPLSLFLPNFERQRSWNQIAKRSQGARRSLSGQPALRVTPSQRLSNTASKSLTVSPENTRRCSKVCLLRSHAPLDEERWKYATDMLTLPRQQNPGKTFPSRYAMARSRRANHGRPRRQSLRRLYQNPCSRTWSWPW